MADFQAAIAVVLEHEDPGLTGAVTHDDGGATRWGISQRAYPNLDVEHLSLEEAEGIYRNSYWGPIGGNAIDDQRVATKLLDMAVNMGVGEGVRLAQEAVGVAVDGVMGPVTSAALNAADPERVLASLREVSAQRYRAIVASNPAKYGPYLTGWLRRAEA